MGNQIPIVGYLVLDDGEPYLAANECDKVAPLLRAPQRLFALRQPLVQPEEAGDHRRRTFVRHRPPGHARCAGPVRVVDVDLDGGGDVKANVVNVEPDPEHIKLGMKVKLTTFVADTDDEGTEAVVFGFEPAA